MSVQLPSLKRMVASGALLVWCALAAIVPAADAAAERASEGSRSHIEAIGGGASCVPSHDHLACQLCRLLRLPTKSSDAAMLFLVAPVARAQFVEARLADVSHSGESANLSRAPPSA